MKNYLSFGGGVNSVALYLHLLDNDVSFEAVFVDHGTDWPETYEYVEMFKEKYPLTVLKPEKPLYQYAWDYKMVPSQMRRWCTRIFKVEIMHKYYQKPCWQMIGFDFGERKRAKIICEDDVETRYPLIEAEIDREGCKNIIRSHKLPMPIKSGCFICPYQRVHQWKELRRNHPGLFCKAVELEKRNMAYRRSSGKKPLFLNPWPRAPLQKVVDENQRQLFKEDEYPPCECGL